MERVGMAWLDPQDLPVDRLGFAQLARLMMCQGGLKRFGRGRHVVLGTSAGTQARWVEPARAPILQDRRNATEFHRYAAKSGQSAGPPPKAPFEVIGHSPV